MRLRRPSKDATTIALVKEYGFDPSWSDERRRLALIERCYDPATTSRLAKLGVRAGWQCLEVGAGGGSIARWLRDQVSPGGTVVAIDLDIRFIENESGVEARKGNILEAELEGDTYDLVHCRALLHHLRGKEVAALRRMAAALRPGGVLVAEEPYSERCSHHALPRGSRPSKPYTTRCPTPTMTGLSRCRRRYTPPDSVRSKPAETPRLSGVRRRRPSFFD